MNQNTESVSITAPAFICTERQWKKLLALVRVKDVMILKSAELCEIHLKNDLEKIGQASGFLANKMFLISVLAFTTLRVKMLIAITSILVVVASTKRQQ